MNINDFFEGLWKYQNDIKSGTITPKRAVAPSNDIADELFSIETAYDQMAPFAKQALEKSNGDFTQFQSLIDSDIAPVRDDGGLDFVQKPKKGNVAQQILGTAGDAALNVFKGVGSLGESLADLIGYGQAAYYEAKGLHGEAELIKKETAKNTLEEDILGGAQDSLDKYSVLGRTSDSLAQGVGQLGGIWATGGLGKLAGLGALGQTALTTGTMFTSSFTSGMGEAYQAGATDLQALKHGLNSGAVDAVSELIFGGLGKGINALGFGKGLSSADDLLAKAVSGKIKNKIAKNLVEFGIKSGAEGLEEVIAGIGQAVSKYNTYMSDEDFLDILADENLLEQFVVGSLTSGIAQGGGLISSTKAGRDFITGYSQNEQAVVKKEAENRISEAEKDGKKLTAKEKSAIEAQVEKDLKKGYISTDTIESVLGGETYKSYRAMLEQETALKKEIEDLENTPESQFTVKQRERLNEARKQLAGLDTKTAKSNLFSEVDKLTQNDTNLRESYNERARRGQAFEADLTKYDEKQKAVVQKAIDSGILNNTNRSHEFVDMVAKISADRGVMFDFADNAKLKESGFTIDGKQVNGFVTADGVTINVNSAKALNSVVGHEITHVLEGTELYNELQNIITEYAKSKGDYQGRYDTLSELYKDIEGADINAELTADLVGDYLFTDVDFVKRLSSEHRNVFQKIFDEIKYLCRVATASSKEARQLEKVKKVFEEAYRAEAKNPTVDGGVKYSIVALDNGNVYVKASRNIITGTTKADQRKNITDFFNDLLEGNSSLDIQTIEGDVLTITKAETAGKARDDYKTVQGQPVKMTDAEFLVKLRAEAHIDELAEISHKNNRPPVPDGKNHAFAKNGFTYRRAYFEDLDGQYYEITLSIGNNGTVATVYNVGKISKGALPSAKIIAVVGSKALGKTPSTFSLSQTTENVKQKNDVYLDAVSRSDIRTDQQDGAEVAAQSTQVAIEEVLAEGAGIRSQLRDNQEKLDAMQPVAGIQIPAEYAQMDIAGKKNWVVEKLRPTGYKVERKGFGIIDFAKKRLKSAFNYFDKNSVEEASFEAIPFVLESGVEIANRSDHKDRNYGTVTIAAPITINGKRGNMAVVVKRTSGNYYKVHRILTPDGSVFNLPEMTNEAESTPAGESPKNGSLATPKDSASNNIISQTEPIVNEDIAPLPPGYEGQGEVDIGENATLGKVDAKTAQEDGKVAKILFDQQQTPKQKSAWKWAKEHIFSHGAVFEDLSLKTGNRELQAKFDNIRRAESRAQNFIGKGKGNVKALVDVKNTVEKAGKTEDFNYYLYHLHNADRMTLDQRFDGISNKSVFGDSVDAETSRKAAINLETLNPEFKQWAKDVYAINKHLRQMMVDEGIISQDTADLWEKMYPHYVPISRAGQTGSSINVPLDTKRTGVNAPVKKATGGNSDFYNVFDTMGSRIEQTYKAISKNRFGVELMNTLGTAFESEKADMDSVLESMDAHEDLLQEGKNGESPTFTVFQNGEKVKFAITEDMYDAMKPSQFTYTSKKMRKINDIRRDVLTTYSPTFALTNPIKDIQDILLNSQHPARTYATIPEAIESVITKDQWYQERMEQGGNQDTYFEGRTKTFKKENGLFKKAMGFVPSKIQAANEVIEQIPRMAEYIASRKMGRSIDVSMLDAARVTTNFGAAGDFTNMLNRNGFTFLGASVEGFNQQVRNIREAKAEGVKGWAKLAGKYLAAGLPVLLLNHFLWDDDEEYAELSDYVKQNYYVIAKNGDGRFIRIPKGRAVAVIQDAFQQMENLITGDDEVDMESFGQLVLNNLAPNNPMDNNIFAPLVQAYTNRTWYGDDLVPTRLQDVPAEEQFDETTDSISRWLGETTNTSPYKWNYLLDQYTGGVGDLLLPYLTPEADGGGFGAALRDKFTVDSVLKNQNVSDFYDTVDKLTTNAKSSRATDEDVLKYKYINSVNAELSDLYAQKREAQNSDLPDDDKYALVREIQRQINNLAEESINSYEDVSISGTYATVADQHYRWYEPGEDSEAEPGWQKITDKQLAKYKKVTRGLGITPDEYWGNKEEYDYAYEYPGKYAVSQVVGDYKTYSKYYDHINDLEADKDKNGKSVSGSRKKKVFDYIDSLPLNYGQKCILFKSQYKSDDSMNMDIVEYLNSRDDIGYDEMVTILTELGFTVDGDNVYWD